MASEEQGPESREVKHPSQVACEWHGHVSTSQFIESRYTVTDEGNGVLTFYVGYKCIRCGEVQEEDLDEEGISMLARYGWNRDTTTIDAEASDRML